MFFLLFPYLAGQDADVIGGAGATIISQMLRMVEPQDRRNPERGLWKVPRLPALTLLSWLSHYNIANATNADVHQSLRLWADLTAINIKKGLPDEGLGNTDAFPCPHSPW